MLSQYFYVIIGHGMSAPGHGREVFDGLNATRKRFLFQLISTVTLPGAKMYDTQMVMHHETSTKYVSLDRKFQKTLV